MANAFQEDEISAMVNPNEPQGEMTLVDPSGIVEDEEDEGQEDEEPDFDDDESFATDEDAA